jgi:hypothetical protein
MSAQGEGENDDDGYLCHIGAELAGDVLDGETGRKKSKASSVQPRKLASTALLC